MRSANSPVFWSTLTVLEWPVMSTMRSERGEHLSSTCTVVVVVVLWTKACTKWFCLHLRSWRGLARHMWTSSTSSWLVAVLPDRSGRTLWPATGLTTSTYSGPQLASTFNIPTLCRSLQLGHRASFVALRWLARCWFPPTTAQL